MCKRKFTSFGIEVKTKLLMIGRTQEWLIAEIKERTGMYADSSNLYKIMTGQLSSPKIESAIKEILYFEKEEVGYEKFTISEI
ncbi:XRE family transcriptional regulator [Clostridium minihomine]|uniref:XRE family transcriptional regulator n=1 Tax=Clostridium minihomine TaxID=2045012 RepID=UPI000C7663AC|nr:XRE family transcriptional regulator [Clostridium minihomine]